MTRYGIIITLLLILIVCTIHTRSQRGHIQCLKLSFNDISGVDIKGRGLTPLTTPSRKPCAQLFVAQSQETSLLRPDDF
jgi:hypothetical protein